MYFSAYKQKIQCTFSGSKQILDQNISVYSGDYREPPNEKNPKILILSLSIFEKTQISIKFF